MTTVRRVEQFTGTISEATDFCADLQLDRLHELETRLQELEAENAELRKSRPPE